MQRIEMPTWKVRAEEEMDLYLRDFRDLAVLRRARSHELHDKYDRRDPAHTPHGYLISVEEMERWARRVLDLGPGGE